MRIGWLSIGCFGWSGRDDEGGERSARYSTCSDACSPGKYRISVVLGEYVYVYVYGCMVVRLYGCTRTCIAPCCIFLLWLGVATVVLVSSGTLLC